MVIKRPADDYFRSPELGDVFGDTGTSTHISFSMHTRSVCRASPSGTASTGGAPISGDGRGMVIGDGDGGNIGVGNGDSIGAGGGCSIGC